MTDWDEFLKNFIEEEKLKECKEKAIILNESSQGRVAEERADNFELSSARRSKKTKQEVIDLCDSSSSDEEEDATELPLVMSKTRDHLRRHPVNRRDDSGKAVVVDRAQHGSNTTKDLTANETKRHTKTVQLQCPQKGMFEACGPDSIQTVKAGKRHSQRRFVKESSTTDVSNLPPADMRFVKQCYVRFGRKLGIIEITTTAPTGVKPYICEERGQKFGNESLLKIHGSIQNAEKPYTCKNCGKSFTKADKLQDHVRIHTGGKPYICEDCGQKFGNISLLKVHCKMHKAEKPRTCKKCGKNFAKADKLKDHVRIHTGGKPYTCKKCGKMFRLIHHFQYHMTVHTGEKPFPCPHCEKRFSQESYLTDHIRTHCPHCWKRFSQESQLTVHIRKHSVEKPYSCGRCGKGFTASNDLRRHFRIHNEQT